MAYAILQWGTMNSVTRNGISEAPVFVLCAGRSGSTLLRFLLDAHPGLACPPETNMPALCGQLATVWSLIEGAPLAVERGDEPPDIPAAAISGIRRTMDEMIGAYLTRRGKRRYCDKSLGAARYTELLLRVYPEARFLCLYRHPMDVIASGIEACPFGLNGYGFDPYIAGTPGNAVLALARFWADNATGILHAEQRFPGTCHRVRYEDLVASPQRTADEVFAFLGVPPVPGISETCFSAERERFGPADYKIWNTSTITARSVGRGWDIPAGMIPPPVLEQINELADQLGYVRVDENWGTASPPADFRAPVSPAPLASPLPPKDDADLVRVHDRIAGRLRAGLLRLDDRFGLRWRQCYGEPFDIVATPPPGGGNEARWRIDLAASTITATADDNDASAWDMVGPTVTWERVLSGDIDLSVAVRRCELRYCDTGATGPVAAATRMDMVADLLGLTSWPPAEGAPCTP
jgi:hypothetical protein